MRLGIGDVFFINPTEDKETMTCLKRPQYFLAAVIKHPSVHMEKLCFSKVRKEQRFDPDLFSVLNGKNSDLL